MNGKHIYLSPHYDDACFSLATTISTNKNAHIFNLFTQSNFTFQQLDSRLNANQLVEVVSKVRELEDECFAKSLGVERSNFSLLDASVERKNPFDLIDIQNEVNEISSLVMPELLRMIHNSKNDNYIYCPMGIGKHRNHLSTLISVLENYNELQSKSRVFFYEELPYSSNKDLKNEGTNRLKKAFPNNQLIRHVTELSKSQFVDKMELISNYRSQLTEATKYSFIPYDSSIKSPHEAYWEVMAG